MSHILLFVVVNIGSMSCSLMPVLITRSNGRYYSADTQKISVDTVDVYTVWTVDM